nr:TPA: hypothetical protein GDO54_003641 [Pyxicephalus adspersus]
MKVLLLALALLFTGAHGKHFWQKDKPHEDHNLWKVIENAIAIAGDAVKNLDYTEIAERFKLKDKLEAAKNNADHIEKVLEGYIEEVWKNYDEKLHKEYPVFREKVYPVLKEFDDHLEELIKKSVKDLLPATTGFFSGLGGEVQKFWHSFADIAEKGRDKLRAQIDDVRVKIEPYTHELKEEYDKYKENVKTGLEDKAKNVKEEFEKDLEELREKLKPYFEEFQKNLIPHAEVLQKKIDSLIKEIHEFFADKSN